MKWRAVGTLALGLGELMQQDAAVKRPACQSGMPGVGWRTRGTPRAPRSSATPLDVPGSSSLCARSAPRSFGQDSADARRNQGVKLVRAESVQAQPLVDIQQPLRRANKTLPATCLEPPFSGGTQRLRQICSRDGATEGRPFQHQELERLPAEFRKGSTGTQILPFPSETRPAIVRAEIDKFER